LRTTRQLTASLKLGALLAEAAMRGAVTPRDAPATLGHAPARNAAAGRRADARYLRVRGAFMTHRRERESMPADFAAVDARRAENVGQRRSSSQARRQGPAADDRSMASERDIAVPSWNAVRYALFGNDGRGGLVERCADDATLVAAALLRHPYLAAYCAHLGRDRLVRAPIYDQSDQGRSELQRLREAHENLAPVWRERRVRGLPVAPGDRGRSDLRKPDFDGALLAAGVQTPTADRGGHLNTSACSPGGEAGTRDQRSS
jgi:hypothetical protein